MRSLRHLLTCRLIRFTSVALTDDGLAFRLRSNHGFANGFDFHNAFWWNELKKKSAKPSQPYLIKFLRSLDKSEDLRANVKATFSRARFNLRYNYF